MYNKIDGVYSCLVYTASRITFHGMVEWLRRRERGESSGSVGVGSAMISDEVWTVPRE